MKSKATGKKATSQGVGESKVFAAEDAPQSSYLEDLHIDGKRIGDHFTPEQIVMLRYEFTDEGIAERNEGRAEAAARVVSGEFDKALEHRGDMLEAGMEPWQAPDPLRELADVHVPPGMKPKFLSKRVMDKVGKRGYEIVKVNGEPVSCGNMILGMMPEYKARQRNAHYAQESRDAIKESQERAREEQARSARDSKEQPYVVPLRPNEIVTGRAVGVSEERAAAGDIPDYDPTATMGLQIRRGNDRTITEI